MQRVLEYLNMFSLSVVAALAIVLPLLFDRAAPERGVLRQSLRQLMLALAAYERDYGCLPYSGLGADAALYQLYPYVDASIFDCPSANGKTEPARFDFESARIVGSCFEYHNEYGGTLTSIRIIATSREGILSNGVYMATGDGVVRWRERGSARLLGAWLTQENFIVRDSSTLSDWLLTHSYPDHRPWSEHHDKNGRLLRMTTDTRSLEFTYSGMRLTGCTIQFPAGVVKERIATDEAGIITRITREPDGWLGLLPDELDPLGIF